LPGSARFLGGLISVIIKRPPDGDARNANDEKTFVRCPYSGDARAASGGDEIGLQHVGGDEQRVATIKPKWEW